MNLCENFRGWKRSCFKFARCLWQRIGLQRNLNIIEQLVFYAIDGGAETSAAA